MQTLLEVLTCLVGVAALVIAPVVWFRMLRAKSRAVYWQSVALFIGPMLLTFVLAQAAGLMPEVPAPSGPPPSFQDVLGDLPTHQIVLLALAGLVWMGGGNLLLHLHRRRLGKTWWQTLNPLEPPFKDFNAREWWTLAGLVVTSLGLVAFALPH